MIGRQKERSRLLEAFASEDSEFVAVYGRRRVGKTFLVRETFDQSFTFQHTGVKNGSRQIQLSRFRQSMIEQGHPGCPELKDWFDAFDNLKTVIKASAAERKVGPVGSEFHFRRGELLERLGVGKEGHSSYRLRVGNVVGAGKNRA